MVSPIYLSIGLIMTITCYLVISVSDSVIRTQSQAIVYLMGAFLLIILENLFVGQAYIIVYVGAIAILFLFVIMMIPSSHFNPKIKINNSIHHQEVFNVLNKPIITVATNKNTQIINTIIQPLIIGFIIYFDYTISQSYSPFYPSWTCDYHNFTDIQTLGLLICIGYPLALIQIGLILLIVMIGIIVVITML